MSKSTTFQWVFHGFSRYSTQVPATLRMNRQWEINLRNGTQRLLANSDKCYTNSCFCNLVWNKTLRTQAIQNGAQKHVICLYQQFISEKLEDYHVLASGISYFYKLAFVCGIYERLVFLVFDFQRL